MVNWCGWRKPFRSLNTLFSSWLLEMFGCLTPLHARQAFSHCWKGSRQAACVVEMYSHVEGFQRKLSIGSESIWAPWHHHHRPGVLAKTVPTGWISREFYSGNTLICSQCCEIFECMHGYQCLRWFTAQVRSQNSKHTSMNCVYIWLCKLVYHLVPFRNLKFWGICPFGAPSWCRCQIGAPWL